MAICVIDTICLHHMFVPYGGLSWRHQLIVLLIHAVAVFLLLLRVTVLAENVFHVTEDYANPAPLVQV